MEYIEMEDYFYCDINMKCARSIHFTLLKLSTSFSVNVKVCPNKLLQFSIE